MGKEKVSRQLYNDWHAVAPGVWRVKDLFVNVYLIHNPADNQWVLVDAGLKTTGKKIRRAARQLFWPAEAPSAVLLTHGHFDHVGSLKTLAEEWDVPIYAHPMERPYLTGRSAYPPPDPCVGGGMMSWLSFLYPKGPIDVSGRLIDLPEDGSIPVLPGWKYYHTPGHAPGHVSLYRSSDKLLIAGDAFVTTKNESALCAIFQPHILSGPPKYFTYNWRSAERSVKLLASLKPQTVAAGHGRPMSGESMRQRLEQLADNFDEEAIPASGRYIGEPALINRDGVQFVPPVPHRRTAILAACMVAAALAGFLLVRSKRHTNRFSFLK